MYKANYLHPVFLFFLAGIPITLIFVDPLPPKIFNIIITLVILYQTNFFIKIVPSINDILIDNIFRKKKIKKQAITKIVVEKNSFLNLMFIHIHMDFSIYRTFIFTSSQSSDNLMNELRGFGNVEIVELHLKTIILNKVFDRF